MKKILVVFYFFVFGFLVSAQIPAGYYDAAAGLTGLPLKTALYNIIKGHIVVDYDGLYASYVSTDNLPTNKVWDMYSIKFDGTANYWFANTANSSDQCGSYNSEGDCYNREHSTPQSWFNGATPMYSDLFNVYPTDGYINNRRADFPIAKVSSASYTSSNGSKVGQCSSCGGYNGNAFEVIDAFKGDFARTFLYMATRYQNVVSSWPSNSNECAAVYAGNGNLVFHPWYITMLLSWCALDSVSQKEIDRNDAVYSIQRNRNPFIDHPEWILDIWGAEASVQQKELVNVDIFPNPASENLTIKFNDLNKAIEKIEIYSFTSSLVKSIENPTYNQSIDVSGFSEGLYTLVIYSGNLVSRNKVVVIH